MNSDNLTDENGVFVVVPNSVIFPCNERPTRVPRRLTDIGKTVPFPCTLPCSPPSLHGYRVKKSLGSGTYGQCVLATDLTTGQDVAVKVVRARSDYTAQALLEISVLLDAMKAKSPTILRINTYFFTKGHHLCIVTPLHGANLYSLLKGNDHQGFTLSAVRHMARQLFTAVAGLHSLGITHMDLKPENIILSNDGAAAAAAAASLTGREPGRERDLSVVLIDLGSAGYISEARPSPPQYVQSRFYRAPEVLLSLPFTEKIDCWSLACVAAELYIGLPLLPGSSEYDLMRRMICFAEQPPTEMLIQSPRASLLFSGIGEYVELFNQKRKADSSSSGANDAAIAARVVASHRRRCQQNGRRPTEPTLRDINDYRLRVPQQRVPKPQRFFKADTLPEVVQAAFDKARRNGREKAAAAELAGFVHFLRACLRADPAKRLSVRQACEHPWLTGSCASVQSMDQWLHTVAAAAAVETLPQLPPPVPRRPTDAFVIPPRSANGSTSSRDRRPRPTTLTQYSKEFLEAAGLSVNDLNLQ